MGEHRAVSPELHRRQLRADGRRLACLERQLPRPAPARLPVGVQQDQLPSPPRARLPERRLRAAGLGTRRGPHPAVVGSPARGGARHRRLLLRLVHAASDRRAGSADGARPARRDDARRILDPGRARRPHAPRQGHAEPAQLGSVPRGRNAAAVDPAAPSQGRGLRALPRQRDRPRLPRCGGGRALQPAGRHRGRAGRRCAAPRAARTRRARHARAGLRAAGHRPRARTLLRLARPAARPRAVRGDAARDGLPDARRHPRRLAAGPARLDPAGRCGAGTGRGCGRPVCSR
ncbi:hypothetical protein D9M68_672410 [compost metagenome]